MFKFWLSRQRRKLYNVKQKWQQLGKLAVFAGLSGMGSASWAVSLPLTSAHWQEIKLGADLRPNQFKFETVDGTPIIRVESNASMSMLASPIEVDLSQTPVLCWRWRVNRVLEKADMSERSGDDYAARLYLSVAIPKSEQSLGLRMQLGLARSIWGSQIPDGAVNYVWDNRQAVNTQLPNAYTDRVTMVVAQSGSKRVGEWVLQTRNIARDIEELFTASAKPIQIALAADTDNTGESAIAEFAAIQFVSDQTQCK
jgi:hypothetical protein